MDPRNLEEHLALQRFEAMRDGEFERADYYQRELNRIRNERLDNQRMMLQPMMVSKFYDEKFLDQLTSKPGSVIPSNGSVVKWTRYDQAVPETHGQGVQFIRPIQFHDERDVVRGPEPTYNVQVADGKWIHIKHHLFHRLKFGVMNMVYVEGTEITDVYRHG
jgi:hypothetical protein